MDAAADVTAPFAGYVTLQVQPGQQVQIGDPIGTVEAVKLEAAVTAPVAGRIRALVRDAAHVQGGQTLCWVEPPAAARD